MSDFVFFCEMRVDTFLGVKMVSFVCRHWVRVQIGEFEVLNRFLLFRCLRFFCG